MTKKKKASSGHILSLIVALAILLTISVTATLMLTGVVTIYEAGVGEIPSIVEAQDLCDKEVKNSSDRLRSYHLDDRSSSFDASINRYKLFYIIDVYQGKTDQEGITHFFINCFVDPNRGRITTFEMNEEKDYKPSALRNRSGNAFGM